MDEAEARRISQMTEQVLDTISTDIGLYKRYLNKYDVNDSNVRYWISKTGDYETSDPEDVYTNMTEK